MFNNITSQKTSYSSGSSMQSHSNGRMMMMLKASREPGASAVWSQAQQWLLLLSVLAAHWSALLQGWKCVINKWDWNSKIYQLSF